MNIKSGEARLVLLCPAWKKFGTAKTVKLGTVILHSKANDVISFADSEELVRNSGLSASALLQVGSDHRLADQEPLEAMLRAKAKLYRMWCGWQGSEAGLVVFFLVLADFNRSVLAETNTQAIRACTVSGQIVVTKRRPATQRVVVPTSATQYTESTKLVTLRINNLFLRIIAIPILTRMALT